VPHYNRLLESTRALLEGVIDYAGLFPPAELGLAEAVANYGRYLSGAEGWLLGRFIVPASRLTEFETVLLSAPPSAKISASVVAGSDLMGAVSAALAFNAHSPYAAIESMELKGDSAEAIRAGANAIPEGFIIYFEIPGDPDPAPLMEAIRSVNCRAKIRTGGLKPQSFPSVEELARFIRRCHEAKLPFKATAGLHHPLRGVHPLTYEPGAPTCTMHGFLNLAIAAAFQSAGGADIEMLLGDQDPRIAFTATDISWGKHSLTTQQIRQTRQRLFVSFGSCSFEEPVSELRAKGLL
jgi:hypothetical protein